MGKETNYFAQSLNEVKNRSGSDLLFTSALAGFEVSIKVIEKLNIPISPAMEIDIQMINQTSKRKYSLKREFKRQLPLESKFHRGCCELEHGYFASSRTCRLQEAPKPNSALRILTYQLRNKKAKETHLKNLKNNLNRRIETARLQRNKELVTSLNKELQEITCR